MKLILIYTVDVNHTLKTKELLAVINPEQDSIIKICELYKNETCDSLSEQDKQQLNDMGQTQGFNGDFEFYSEEYETGDLI